jgi:hypothetical protein
MSYSSDTGVSEKETGRGDVEKKKSSGGQPVQLSKTTKRFVDSGRGSGKPAESQPVITNSPQPNISNRPPKLMPKDKHDDSLDEVAVIKEGKQEKKETKVRREPKNFEELEASMAELAQEQRELDERRKILAEDRELREATRESLAEERKKLLLPNGDVKLAGNLRFGRNQMQQRSGQVHVSKHGAEFGVDSNTEYQDLATTFMKDTSKGEYVQIGKTIIKYDKDAKPLKPTTQPGNGFIGIAHDDEMRTFYVADPGISEDPLAFAIQNTFKKHKLPTEEGDEGAEPLDTGDLETAAEDIEPGEQKDWGKGFLVDHADDEVEIHLEQQRLNNEKAKLIAVKKNLQDVKCQVEFGSAYAILDVARFGEREWCLTGKGPMSRAPCLLSSGVDEPDPQQMTAKAGIRKEQKEGKKELTYQIMVFDPPRAIVLKSKQRPEQEEKSAQKGADDLAATAKEKKWKTIKVYGAGRKWRSVDEDTPYLLSADAEQRSQKILQGLRPGGQIDAYVSGNEIVGFVQATGDAEAETSQKPGARRQGGQEKKPARGERKPASSQQADDDADDEPPKSARTSKKAATGQGRTQKGKKTGKDNSLG